MMVTSMLAAASLAGRAIGLAIATAANSIVVRVVSCMLMTVGLGDDEALMIWLMGSLSLVLSCVLRMIVGTGRWIDAFMSVSICRCIVINVMVSLHRCIAGLSG
jgi:hypothetical protein